METIFKCDANPSPLRYAANITANRLPATAIPNVPAPPICDAAPVGLSAGGPSGADEGGEPTRGTTGPPAGDPEVVGAGVGALVSRAGVGDAGVREGAGVAGAGGRGCEGP